jgi:ssDNA-binding Zn-finger/Zn-ribbon topoisomerase 1
MPFCTECGKQVNETANYCTSCGHNLKAKNPPRVEIAYGPVSQTPKCVEHPKSNVIGKCTDCGRVICNVCLTATAFKIKASQNVLIAAVAAVADKFYCPSCIDKLLQKSIEIKCPVCGSQTEIRRAKRGIDAGLEFHVCIKYPECKGKVAHKGAL